MVLCGQYASEDNIGDDHRYRETKYFSVGGKPRVHEKGDYTKCMYNLTEHRKANPEFWAEVHEYMLIMQQPSGFVDKHIMKWHLEKQGKRYACSLCQRDLFTGA